LFEPLGFAKSTKTIIFAVAILNQNGFHQEKHIVHIVGGFRNCRCISVLLPDVRISGGIADIHVQW
jgi:hypothetical protein